MKIVVPFFISIRAGVVSIALSLCCLQWGCTDAGTAKTTESAEAKATLTDTPESNANKSKINAKDEALQDGEEDLANSLDKEIDQDPISEKEIDLDDKDDTPEVDIDVAENPKNNSSTAPDTDDETDEDL